MSDVVKKKRAALYVRVSSQEQAEKYGSDVQLNQMKKWLGAFEEKFTLEKKHIYIDEGYSGASEVEEREAMPKLFQAAKRKEFDVVLVWKLDRFFRHTQLLLNAVYELRDLGIGFISTTQTEIDSTSTFGKVILVMLSAIAEMERDLIIERTGAGRMEAADAGKFVGGMHTYGYDIDEDQKLSVNSERAKIVRKLFKWYVKDRLNSYQIQQKINAMKVPTQADIEEQELRKKKKLKKSKRTKNPPCFWHTKTIRRVLQNEAYTGQYFYGKKTKKYDPVKKKKVEVINPPEAWIKIICPKIVDRHIWEEAKELLKKNEKSQKRSKHAYLLSGKVFCGACNSSYQGYLQPKVKTQNGVKKVMAKYPNYRCSLSNLTKAGIPCRNRQISARALEGVVWNELHALLADPAVFIKRIEEQEKNQDDLQALEEKRCDKQQELDSIITELDGVMMLFQKGLKYRGKGELEKVTDRLLADQKRLEDDLDSLTSRLMSAEDKRDRLLSAKRLAKKYGKKLDDMDADEQKITVQDLVNRVLIFEKKIRIELLIPKPPKPVGGRNRNGDVYGATGRD